MRRSTPRPEQSFTLIVGLPQAVAGAGKVHLRPMGNETEVVVVSATAGSFSAAVAAGRDETIEVRFESEAGLSDPVALVPAVMTRGAPELAPTDSNGQVVSAPDGQGMVTVTNDGGPGQPLVIGATPDSDLLVANTTSGEVVTTRTDSQGRFSVRIAGARGDVVRILLVNSTSVAATSDYLSYSVP
jgi:hypothetical protein